MAKSLYGLLICVNLAFIANFHITYLSFNAIRENKILAKISESTVTGPYRDKSWFPIKRDSNLVSSVTENS